MAITRRLVSRLDAWSQVVSPGSWLHNSLRDGFKFELLYTPVQGRKPHQPVLAQPSMDFMDGIVSEYLERDIISDVTTQVEQEGHVRDPDRIAAIKAF